MRSSSWIFTRASTTTKMTSVCDRVHLFVIAVDCHGHCLWRFILFVTLWLKLVVAHCVIPSMCVVRKKVFVETLLFVTHHADMLSVSIQKRKNLYSSCRFFSSVHCILVTDSLHRENKFTSTGRRLTRRQATSRPDHFVARDMVNDVQGSSTKRKARMSE